MVFHRNKLYAFLRNYRATPHCSSGMAPADVLFGRPLRIKLPEAPLLSPSHSNARLRQADAVAKNRMKVNADKMCHVAPSALKVGDMVLCCQKKDGKLSLPTTPAHTKSLHQRFHGDS